MGKTPEHKQLHHPYGPAMGLRYRRKVPPVAPDAENSNSLNRAEVAPSSGKQRRQQQQQQQKEAERGDNQLEHQAPVPVPRAEPTDGGQQPEAPPTYARKKKHKQPRKQLSPERAAEDRPASPVPPPAAVERAAPVAGAATDTPTTLPTGATTATTGATPTTPAPTTTSKPKRPSKKKVKRTVADAAPAAVVEKEKLASVPNNGMAAEAPVTLEQVEPLRAQKESAESRRRKPVGNSKRKDSPSLMKQLLWKVKAPVAAPVAPAAPERVSVYAAAAAAVEESDAAARVREEEDEEAAFAAAERHSLKRMSASLAKSMSSFPAESSSQETQSGSEDESSFAHYSLLSGDDSLEPSPPAFGAADLLESCFPTPLSLESVASAKRRSPKTQVHEILLDNFAFSPAELSIVKGDLVVWRVSEQTLGMVEHALDATLVDASGSFVRRTSTPLLRPGSGFAWRLDVAGRLEIECSVYKSQCAVQISADVAAKRRYAVARANTLQALADPPRRSKKLSAKAKRAAKLAREALAATAAAAAAVDGAEDSEAGSAEPVEVFHRSTDLDAGVCREVLSQLEDVKAAAVAAFIVVGDIACPVAEPAALRDAGADVAESEGDAEAAAGVENDEVEDFQQRIIAMLQRSEESQARQRDGFVVPDSGFNAGSAYAFFKRRFARVQNAEEAAVYARCPERRAPREGLTVARVLRALVG